ncbi:MAG: PLP-dependent aminotransferase family protein, partial [Acidimicrobiia bacterium]|nr:PLP-dependent aminotransferase family protein [Acidimicrobiia bacterium]
MTALYETIADHITEQIRSGVYAPGDRLPSVRRIKSDHGVSASTAVEALRLLLDRNLAVNRPRSGYFVAKPRQSKPTRRVPQSRVDRSMQARDLRTPLSLRLNLGIGNPQRPTLGAAVQGPELMAVTAMNRLVSQAMRLNPVESHSYDAPPGSPDLRRALARRAPAAGMEVAPEEIVITSGAKEAVYLSIRAVTRPGDTVAIESPAYYALLEVLASLQLKVVEIPADPNRGIDLDSLAGVLDRHRIAAVALVSNFSNPTGSCMTDEDKATLTSLLARKRVPLVEDDVYGDLAFEGHRPKAIKAFDRDGWVLHCSSHSKTVSPGMRIGWCVPGRFLNQVEHLKLVVNQATATAPQLALASFLDSGRFERHLRRIRPLFARQVDDMIAAVERHLPSDTRHTSPAGGHVLWLQVPGLDSLALYEEAASRGIHIAPGPLFSAGRRYLDCLRLNCGFAFTDETDAQMAALGE